MSTSVIPFSVLETTIDGVHEAYTTGRLTACELVQTYLNRIDTYDKQGPAINAIILSAGTEHRVAAGSSPWRALSISGSVTVQPSVLAQAMYFWRKTLPVKGTRQRPRIGFEPMWIWNRQPHRRLLSGALTFQNSQC
jgi:hypothetical protein